MVANDGGHRAQVGFADEKSVVCFVEIGTLPEGSVKDAQGKGRFEWEREQAAQNESLAKEKVQTLC